MSLKDGLSKHEKFTPEKQSPKESKVKGSYRPKHDNPKIKRKTGPMKGC